MIEIGGKLFCLDAIEAVIPVGVSEGNALILLRSGASVTVRVPYLEVRDKVSARG